MVSIRKIVNTKKTQWHIYSQRVNEDASSNEVITKTYTIYRGKRLILEICKHD